jgi:hypothetical protein
MRAKFASAGWGVALAAFLAGCSATPTAPNKDEEQVRQAFVAFQEALKARDAEKLWALLDSDSQADAERAAKKVRDEYAKAAPEKRAEQEKALGLPGKELESLKGQGFLKTKRFHGKYDEIPGSKIDKIVVQGEKATVNYTEPDGDAEKLALVRQGGGWKVSVAMP